MKISSNSASLCRFVLIPALAAALLALSPVSALAAPAASAYEGLAAADVTDTLNLRAEPSPEGKILGKCYRGGGGKVLERRNGWTKIRSGGLEGWLKDDYLLFGAEIAPMAKELGLLKAQVTAQTLNVRETPSTEAAIVGLAPEGESYPVLAEEGDWVKIQLAADVSGYVSSQYVKVLPSPGKAVSIEAEKAAAAEAKKEEQKSYVISASDDDLYLMAACAMMEAGDSYEGQLAVSNVIINRVKSGLGSSVSSVIYAKGQFPGANSGLLASYLAKGPSKTALKAAEAALTGTNNIGGYLFFKSARSANTAAYSSYQIIGGNCFYAK